MIKTKSPFVIFVFYYLPVILWMALIFWLSSISGLKTGAEPIELEIFLRKTAHLFEYFILTLLFWRIFQEHLKISIFKTGIFCFILVVLYATSDEIHQYFVEDRAGRVIDVLVDGAGAILAISWGNFISKTKRNKN
jgi:VanZ family protein